MRIIMNTFCFTSKDEERYARASLILAKRLGLIDDSSLDAVKVRCNEENENRWMWIKQLISEGNR